MKRGRGLPMWFFGIVAVTLLWPDCVLRPRGRDNIRIARRAATSGVRTGSCTDDGGGGLVGSTAGAACGVAIANRISHDHGYWRHDGADGSCPAGNRDRHRNIGNHLGFNGELGGTAATLVGCRTRGIFRHLPWSRSWYRVAGGRGCPPLQHRVCGRNRLPTRCRHQHRFDTSLEHWQSGTANCRCGRGNSRGGLPVA